jgi:hypothetical protein
MCLLVQNMEPDIPNNEGERISNYIMWGYALSPMNTTKYVYPYRVHGFAAYALKKTMNHGMEEAQSNV